MDIIFLTNRLVRKNSSSVCLVQKGESSFGIFVRVLVGLDQAAAREAFKSVLSKASLNSNQIHFINLIIDYLSKNGGKLMDEPFLHVHQDGVFGVFSDTEVEEVVQIVRFLQNNAKIQSIIS